MTRSFTLSLLAALFCLSPAAEVPDSYRELKFGGDTLQVRKYFPASENQLYTVRRCPESPGAGVTIYTLIYKKGMVDSAWLYFVDNRFAQAVEYCVPGREFLEKTLRGLTARYGHFVGREESCWRRSGRFLIRVNWFERRSMAITAFSDEKLSALLSERLSPTADEQVRTIDHELKKLDGELKRLERPKRPERPQLTPPSK